MINDFIVFMSIVIFGVLLVSIIFQPQIFKTKKINKHQFSYYRYLLLILFPLLAVLYIYQIHGIKVVYIYLSFALFGTILEWLVGFSYQMTVGEKLWEYFKLPLIGGYTSFLGIPLWGMAGVMFWLLTRIFI